MDKVTVRDQLLAAMLPIAAEQGWGEAALIEATEAARLTEIDRHRALPEGPLTLIHHWLEQANLFACDEKPSMLKEKKIRERIHHLVMRRFEYFTPHRQAYQKALLHLAMPWHVGAGLSVATSTVDAIWRAAGDHAHDYNYYRKRLLLVGVITSTECVWLKDDSEDLADTRQFLSARIENVLTFGGWIRKWVG